MNANSKGFKWEQLFREQMQQSFPNALLFRINNNMGNYRGVSNICDYMCFDGQRLYLMELKAHKGASIPFDAIRQLDQLASVKYIDNCVIGVLLWLYDKDRILFIPSQTLAKMKKDGKKSVGIKSIEEGYKIIDIPFTVLRVYPKVDYTYLKDDIFLMQKDEG